MQYVNISKIDQVYRDVEILGLILSTHLMSDRTHSHCLYHVNIAMAATSNIRCLSFTFFGDFCIHAFRTCFRLPGHRTLPSPR